MRGFCRRDTKARHGQKLALEQIASARLSEIAKRCQRTAWSIAMTALDDRRFRCPVGMGNPNLHAAAGVAN
jgi:hypothetical protein